MSSSLVVREATAAELVACVAIRRRVFVCEQRVPREEDQDGLDPECVHFIALLDGRAVGTARMYVDAGVARAQRVAVVPELRRGGIGAALMAALETAARLRGLARVELHAQVPVIEFYERLGYTAEGDVFFEAEIPHRSMRRAL